MGSNSAILFCLPSQWGSIRKRKNLLLFYRRLPGRVAQSVGHLTRKSGPGFDTRSGNILSFLLLLFQEGQLSVTGESMCTKYTK